MLSAIVARRIAASEDKMMEPQSEMYASLTPRELVKLYNSGQTLLGKGEDSFVKKFRDAKTGVARVEKMREDLIAMHGYAELGTSSESPDAEVYFWVVEKPRSPKTEDAPTAVAAPRVGVTTLDLSQRLELLVSHNPKKNPSRARDTFEVYFSLAEEVTEPTGEDFVAAMVARGWSRKLALSTLHWDTEHCFVRLGPVEDEADMSASLPPEETAIGVAG